MFYGYKHHFYKEKTSGLKMLWLELVNNKLKLMWNLKKQKNTPNCYDENFNLIEE